MNIVGNEVTSMKTVLDYKNDFLCVLTESEISNGPCGAVPMKEWHPVHAAEEAEVRTLVGRPVTEVNSDEGIYIDEEGNVFQLAEKGRNKPMEVEQSAWEEEPAGADAQVSANGQKPKEGKAEGAASDNRRGKVRQERTPNRKAKRRSARAESANGLNDHIENGATKEDSGFAAPMFAELNLREKFAEVRRRLGYIQKRGHNERHNYSYVTAADLAGSVGDILAELGVVVIPQLQSISTETPRSSSDRIARVVMNYRFVDARSGEELTVRVPGEGADPGDKAPYKAMTGALKYALLQSFLLGTGDDPEDEIRRFEGSARLGACHHAGTGARAAGTDRGDRNRARAGTRLLPDLCAWRDDRGLVPPCARLAQPQTDQTEQPGERSPCPELSGCNRTQRSGTIGGDRGSAPAMLRSSWARRLSKRRACCGR